MLTILLLLSLCGCKTKYVATESHSTDTLRIADTVYLLRRVETSILQMDSNITSEIKTATIQITDFDSLGNVTRLTNIGLHSDRNIRSGSVSSVATAGKEQMSASHKEQAVHKTDYIRKEVRVPYVPWWVTAAGFAMIIAALIFFIRTKLK